jgi:phosphoribosylamine--glycine ligase
MPGVEIFHAGTAREGDRLVTSGGRVLVATGMAPSIVDAAAAAYAAADRIEFEGKHVRRDIGAHGLRASRM